MTADPYGPATELRIELRPDAAPDTVVGIVHEMGLLAAGHPGWMFTVGLGDSGRAGLPRFTVGPGVGLADVVAEAAAWTDRSARFPGDVTLRADGDTYARYYEVRGAAPPTPDGFSAAVAALGGPRRPGAEPVRWRIVFGGPARPVATFDATRNEPPAGAPAAMRALVEATAGDPAVRGLTVAVGDREAAGPARLDVRVEVGPGADDTRIEAACRAALDASGLPYDFGLDHTR